MRICAWWHPARDADLPVIRWELKTRPPQVVVRLPNGTGLRVPLSCTDVVSADGQLERRTRFTVDALLTLTALLDALDQRGDE